MRFQKAFTVVASIALIAPLTVALASPAAAAKAKAPSAPRAVAATAGNGQATVTWAAPKSNGGARIAGYTVYSSTSKTGPWKRVVKNTKQARVTVSKLVNGKQYWFKVTARNSRGVSPGGITTRSVTPVAVPSAPTNLTATPGDSNITVTWAAPTNSGGSPITGYTVTYSQKATGPWSEAATVTTSDSPVMIEGLTNGKPYFVRVIASNNQGTGTPAVSKETTPRTTPDAPSALAATPGDSSISLTWKAPSNSGGAAITGYTVAYSTSATGPWTPFADNVKKTNTTVTGLTNGTAYWFQVAAVNSAGAGTATVTNSAATPRTVPSAPQNITTTPGNASITVTWQPPTSDGGSPLTGYIVSAATSAKGPWVEFSKTVNLTTTAYKLTNGTNYWFKVVATTSAGASPAAIVGPVAPVTPPSAPVPAWTATTSSSVTVTWPAVNTATSYTCASTAGTTTVTGTSCVVSLPADSLATVTVSACNVGGCTPASVKTASNPVTPTNAKVTLAEQKTGGGARTVEVSWDGAAGTQTCVEVVGTNIVPCTTNTTLRIGNLEAYKAYTFTVNVFNKQTKKNAGVATAPVFPAVPAAVTTLTATAQTGYDAGTVANIQADIDLKWSAAAGAENYFVARGGTTPVEVAAGTTVYSDNLFAWNATRSYQVYACATQGCGTGSPVASATSAPTPMTPTATRTNADRTVVTFTADTMVTPNQSWRIKMCDRTANPGCDPITDANWNSDWRTKTGDIKRTDLNANRTYAWVVVSRVNTNGTGLGSYGRIRTLN